MKVIVGKYEQYPIEDSIGKAVGFFIYVNDRNFYIDTIISNESLIDKTEEEVLSLAWDTLKVQIQAKVDKLNALPPLVGSEWNPPIEPSQKEESQLLEKELPREEVIE